ncbi:MAG: AsnC family transcriptional regulator [Bacteroidales bacterium]|nr:AsnC family transcriptional regulator [Bacteroidales bacterium]
MGRNTYDKLDLKILAMLDQNARTPYQEIARECGVSGAAVHQRIQRLIANGTIVGSQALISSTAMGYDTCAYIGIYMTDPSQYQDTLKALERIPEVVECHYTTGKYDFLTKVYARNNDHLLSLLQDIQKIGKTRTETLVSFKEIFKRQVPANPAPSSMKHRSRD